MIQGTDASESAALALTNCRRDLDSRDLPETLGGCYGATSAVREVRGGRSAGSTAVSWGRNRGYRNLSQVICSRGKALELKEQGMK